MRYITRDAVRAAAQPPLLRPRPVILEDALPGASYERWLSSSSCGTVRTSRAMAPMAGTDTVLPSHFSVRTEGRQADRRMTERSVGTAQVRVVAAYRCRGGSRRVQR